MKTAIFSILLFISILIQIALKPMLTFWGMGPDLSILVLCFAAFALPRNSVTIMGFATGFIRDSLGFSMLGVGSLLFTIVAFAAASLLRKRSFQSLFEVTLYFSIVILGFFFLYHVFINLFSDGFGVMIVTQVLPSTLLSVLILVIIFILVPKMFWYRINLYGQTRY